MPVTGSSHAVSRHGMRIFSGTASFYWEDPVPAAHDRISVDASTNVFKLKCVSGAARCREISHSEALLGYEESARVYEDIAFELLETRAWIVQRCDIWKLPRHLTRHPMNGWPQRKEYMS